MKQIERKQGWADPDSPTQSIGSEIIHGRKVKHNEKMYSLDNVFSTTEQNIFFEKFPDETYCIEPKADGMSGKLIYNNGALQTGVTRGNGLIGENITENVIVVSNVPKTVSDKGLFDVRGEFVIEQKDFLRINAELIEKGLEPYKAARNLVAGTMRGLSSNDVIERCVKFYAYGTTSWKDKDYLVRRKMLTELGFEYVPTLIIDTLEGVEIMCESINSAREHYGYEIDGAVIKLNSAELQEALGFTSKDPRWAVARKWNREGIITRITAVEDQVGRTGVITPVAKIEPVEIGGVTVTSATLHNYDEIERLGIFIGSKISIIRSGDVIPKIESVILENDGVARQFGIIKAPCQCPVCNYEVMEIGAKLYCSNKYCFGQRLAQLNFFVSREGLNIMDLSEATIKQLVYKGFVKEPADIYKVTKRNLLTLDGFAEKSADKLLENIEMSRTPTLERFITAMGIPGIGIKTSQALAKKFWSIENILKATLFDLIAIRDIGPSTADAIMSWIGDKDTMDGLERLLEFITPTHVIDDTEQLLEGKTFVITGGFNFPRDELSKVLEKYGAKVSGSVSAKTALVIVGDNPGDNKINAAIKHKVMTLEAAKFSIKEIINFIFTLYNYESQRVF